MLLVTTFKIDKNSRKMKNFQFVSPRQQGTTSYYFKGFLTIDFHDYSKQLLDSPFSLAEVVICLAFRDNFYL